MLKCLNINSESREIVQNGVKDTAKNHNEATLCHISYLYIQTNNIDHEKNISAIFVPGCRSHRG